jgi:hypothetical protein
MKGAKHICSFAAIILINACSNSPQLTEDQKITISQEIRNTLGIIAKT